MYITIIIMHECSFYTFGPIFWDSKFNRIIIFLKNNNTDGIMHCWKEFGTDPIKIEALNWKFLIKKMK